ncbi:DNA glycosylase [Lonepinella koalarum]|uniref:G/U mismatch-specific uracil-DNA glycosylase n=1 Tax=Lonepinella koalarum TaxID=53417 RepID=A0A4R1L0D5_9PAST|nr:DNA glycosylase [Lonepinella koalarum]MDH2927004.1 DNA glycosylase [Lonepinella koalarum]TCK70340.1 G/U mismatch-specific uracil-DNA glycosylase [Lonepinella koalarum]TFJ89274.1 DNA glycosylase [Lonepinella koalarum]
MQAIIETHPFPPVLPPQAKVMMMGTFPPTVEKRCMEFHYPNFQNDMWRIYGLVFFNDKHYFQVKNEKCFDPERIKNFLIERGIASCPTVQKAIREQGNASDKFLKIVEPVNLAKVLKQLPDCQWIFTTGGKATETLLSLLPEKLKEPKTNEFIDFSFAGRELKLYRLPSTSRAYPLSFEKKAEAYQYFFKLAGIL